MFLLGQVLVLSIVLRSDTLQSSFFTLGQGGNRFQPADPVELLLTIDRSGTAVTCVTHCVRQKLCRTFEQNSDSHQCRLFVGSIETGTRVPTSSNTVVGWIPIGAALFTLYDAPQSQCADDRFLEMDLSSGRCRCPMYTFWNGSICVNQRFHGAACLNDSWCRTDVDVNCHASTCVSGYPSLMTGTTFSTTTQITSMDMTTCKDPRPSLLFSLPPFILSR